MRKIYLKTKCITKKSLLFKRCSLNKIKKDININIIKFILKKHQLKYKNKKRVRCC